MKRGNKKLFFVSIFMLAFWAGFFIFSKKSLAGDNLYINEVLLNGKSGEEFIELYNPTDSSISLNNYYLAYYSSARDWPSPYRNKKFPDTAEIKSKGYYLIVIKTGDLSALTADWNLGYSSHQLSDSSGSLVIFPNNTFAESNAIDSISWGKVEYVKKGSEFIPSQDGKSYEKKTSGWQESEQAGGTPGKENSPWLEKAPEPDLSVGIKIDMDKNVYKNMYANFEVNYTGATSLTKYTWNFGDGHKSYLQKTKHKYEEAGKYQASVTIRGDKSAKKNFTVEVEEYDAPKVRIISLSPNPAGRDSKKEWIEIKNDSKKKINLEGWIIATGWEKLINHKVTKKFVIKAKESKKLTSKFCAFTLNNVKNKIELRDPTGETVQKIKYNRKKNKIEEDEVFALAGKKWDRDKSEAEPEGGQKEAGNSSSDEESFSRLNEENENNDAGEINIFIPEREMESGIGKSTPDVSWERKKESRIQLISYGTTINTPKVISQSQPMVLGISDEKITPQKKHWTVSLFDNSVRKINFGLNWVLNKI